VEASFKEQEQLVWEQLSGLVRDAAWLKSYVVSSLLVFKEAMQVGGGLLLAAAGTGCWEQEAVSRL
jgi:hypothetical protein